MRKMTRRQLSREMLLPLPVQKALALEYHHLALSVLAAGRGGIDQAVSLVQAVCHVRHLATVLDAVATRAEAGAAWSLSAAERTAIARALSACEALLVREPYHRFQSAWAQMLRELSWIAALEPGSAPLPDATGGLTQRLTMQEARL